MSYDNWKLATPPSYDKDIDYDSHTRPCLMCNASGKVIDDDHWLIDCEHCHGSGRIAFECDGYPHDCPGCQCFCKACR